MKNETATISIVAAIIVGGMVGYYGATFGTAGMTKTVTISTTETLMTTIKPNGLDAISLSQGLSLCSADCISVYPAPYLNAVVLVNASSSPLSSIRLMVNGTDEGIVYSGGINMTHFSLDLRSSCSSPLVPIVAGKNYSILLVAAFANGDQSTAAAITEAS